MHTEDVYRAQGFGGQLGPGRNWALLIVDFVVGFNDPALFGGGNIDDAVQTTRGLLAFARRESLPVAHTRCVYAQDGADAGVFAQRNTRSLMFTEAAACSQIVPELQPVDGELIVRKTVPSGFFLSPLAPWLAMRGVDTLLVAGCTTSGCVRASVVDAVSHNLRTIVVSDCVGDRALEPHRANLFDMQQKYADVMSCEEVIATYGRLELSGRLS
jgi:maleamate amidohydrolase